MTLFLPIGCDPERGVSIADAIIVHGDLDEPRRHYAVRLSLECERPIEPERAMQYCMNVVDGWDRVRKKLLAEELHSTRIDPRESLSNGRTPIAAERWRTLEPDFLISAAAENGIEVAIDVLISTAATVQLIEPTIVNDSDLCEVINRIFPAEMPRIAHAEHLIRKELRARSFAAVGNDRLRPILDRPEFKKRRKTRGRPARD